MSFQKFKTDSCCVGGRHRPSTVKVYGAKTSKVSKVLFSYCSNCNRKKSLTVSDNTIQAEGLSSFFKNLGKVCVKAGKKLATNELKNPAGALEISANVGTAAAGTNPKAALSILPEVIKFYHEGRGLYLGKLICFFTI